MKILIVEDERLLADSLRTLLEKKGFTVEVAYDGETGAQYALLGIYDLLILDVMMPKMDGYQLTRQVRSQRCTTPILNPSPSSPPMRSCCKARTAIPPQGLGFPTASSPCPAKCGGWWRACWSWPGWTTAA